MQQAHRASAWDVIVSLVIMFDLAVAQPLLDLIGRHAPFLIAHDASRAQIWLMVVGLAIGVPLVLALVALAVRKLHPLGGAIVHGVLFGFFVGILLLRLFKELPGIGDLSGAVLLVLTLLVGAGAGAYFYRSELVRSFLRMGAPLPLVVIALFVFFSPASQILFPKGVETAVENATAKDVPVVVLLFDELPVATLMTRDGSVDGELFPNFKRLQRESTWFRNATTVHDMTARAVPAILDGNYPSREDLPVLGDHPDNLFTILGRTHKVTALEPITGLCPPEYCGEQEAEVGALVSDLWVLANHVVLPDDLKGWLPALGDTWAGFVEAPTGGGESRVDPRRFVIESDRAAQAERFVGAIDGDPPGSLHFLHLTLPHVPWEYLPSGRAYVEDEVPGKVSGGWAEDEWLVKQGYQRHLFQARFTDRILGRVIERLHDTGLYDRALVIALADHGITIAPGRRQRDAAPDSVGSIASIPLFVKEPFQDGPEIVDAPVETIDVLPTIVDMLGIESGVAFDGRPLNGDLPTDRTRRMPIEGFEIEPAGDQMMPVVRAKYDLFGPDLHDLFAIVPDGSSDLMGRSIRALTIGSRAPYEVALVNRRGYETFDPGGSVCPCMIDAYLDRLPDEPARVAITVNGVVVAVTRTPVVDGPEIDERRFYAMVPPGVFDAGENEVAFYLVEGGRQPVLRPIPRS